MMHFSKGEVRGIALLAFLILLVALAPKIYRQLTPDQSFDWEYTHLVDSLDQLSTADKKPYNYSNKNYSDYPKREYNNKYNSKRTQSRPKEEIAIQLVEFDPNTADRQTLLQLGIPERVVGRLQNYRSKGGKFYKPEDLEKIYGLSSELFQTIEPYIQIKQEAKKEWPKKWDNSTSKKDSTKTWTKKSFPKKEIEPININTADAAAYQSLRGIGPAYSKRIINFREALGGFTSVNQIADVYGFPDSTFQAIKPFLILEENPTITKIDINSVNKKELAAHPYISFKKAAAIIKYRDRHGAFTSADDIQKLYALSKQDKERIIPYLEFNTNE